MPATTKRRGDYLIRAGEGPPGHWFYMIFERGGGRGRPAGRLVAYLAGFRSKRGALLAGRKRAIAEPML